MLENGSLVENRKKFILVFLVGNRTLFCVFLVGNGQIGYRVNNEAISSQVSGRK